MRGKPQFGPGADDNYELSGGYGEWRGLDGTIESTDDKGGTMAKKAKATSSTKPRRLLTTAEVHREVDKLGKAFGRVAEERAGGSQTAELDVPFEPVAEPEALEPPDMVGGHPQSRLPDHKPPEQPTGDAAAGSWMEKARNTPHLVVQGGQILVAADQHARGHDDGACGRHGGRCGWKGLLGE